MRRSCRSAAGKLAGHATAEAFKLHELEHFAHARFDLRLLHAADPQAVTDIRLHRHVREQGVILENRVYAAFIGFGVRNIRAFKQHGAAVRHLKA